jgi:gliding motility-associated-like protein
MLVAPTSGTPPFTYTWENSNSVAALGTNLFTGLQTVIATDINGCQGDVSYFIGNTPPPVAEYSYYLDSCTSEITLFSETEDIVYSYWKIGEELLSNESSTTLQLKQGGVYPITLISATEYCSDSVTQIIDLISTDVLNRVNFPNVFTPNNDFKNDYFTLNGLKECDQGIFRIFNRWGDEMYYTLAPLLEPWDGKHLGVDVAEGTYFYILDLKYTKLKGVLNLYR